MRARSCTIEADSVEDFIYKAKEEMMVRQANRMVSKRSKRIQKFNINLFLGMKVKKLPLVPEMDSLDEENENYSPQSEELFL